MRQSSGVDQSSETLIRDARTGASFPNGGPFLAATTNKPTVQWMETVPLCDEDKAKILSGNAQRLFRM